MRTRREHSSPSTAYVPTRRLTPAVLVFAPFSLPSLIWRLLSRIALLPVITGMAYEFIRLTARFADRRWMRVLTAPNLALQRLTTRDPDDGMLEVAIAALKAVLTSEDVLVGEAAE